VDHGNGSHGAPPREPPCGAGSSRGPGYRAVIRKEPFTGVALELPLERFPSRLAQHDGTCALVRMEVSGRRAGSPAKSGLAILKAGDCGDGPVEMSRQA
jgi:hypothetical protein